MYYPSFDIHYSLFDIRYSQYIPKHYLTFCYLSRYAPIILGFHTLRIVSYSEADVLAVNSAPSEVLLNKIQYPFPRSNGCDPGTRVYPLP